MFYENKIQSKEIGYFMSKTTLGSSICYYRKDFPTYYAL